ncbi:MAG TPA: hypothetical protein VLN49_10435 [Gemmatimonadaceae bacterium]|nr:hypothetical protein [Gemmatimonadaceae bacterium]
MTNLVTAMQMQEQYLGRRAVHAVALVATLLVLGVTVAFWRVAYHGEVSRFFHIDDPRPVPAELTESGAHVYHGEYGYDGKFFLVLAVDPLLLRPSSVAMLDNPVYRSRRILLPAVTFALSGGRPLAAEYVFVAINVIAFAALIWLLDFLLAGAAAELRSAAICLAATATWIALLFGTAELLETALLVGSFVAYRRARFASVAIALALAMLCRETSFLVFAAFVVTAVGQKQRRLLLHLAWAWIPAAAWNAAVWLHLRKAGIVLGERNFDWPLVGLWDAITHPIASMGLINKVYWILSLVVLFAVAATFVWNARAIFRTNVPMALSGLAYVALLTCAGSAVLEYHLGFDRAFLPLFIFCGAGLVASGRYTAARWVIAAQALVTLGWLLHLGVKEFRVI